MYYIKTKHVLFCFSFLYFVCKFYLIYKQFLSGEIMKKKILKWLKILGIITISFITIMIIAFIILNYAFPLPKDKLEREKSVMVYGRDGDLLRAFTTEDGMWRTYTPIEEVSPMFKDALLSYEDERFYYHPGIDPFALLRAVWTNITSGRIVSGFSTITMQLARMIEPKDRTLISKLIEMFRTVQIELSYSKDEILEFYLNIAPYGGNIEGIGSASYIYFNKPHNKLSTGEIALLVGLPNSPTQYRPDLYPENAKKQRDKVLKLINKEGVITDKQYQEALYEEIPDNRYDMPFYAPHFTDYMKLNTKEESHIYTTIDLEKQKACDELLKNHIRRLKQRGINNGAIVVIDNETREVLAYIGSAGYFDDDNQGMVNGVVSNRSPGSALKPFVYVLSAEEGSIGTGTMLIDLPENFSGFEPQNYDKKFRGMVSASEALALSLNIPAVKLLQGLKFKNLYNKLKEGGLSTLTHPEEYYGLSLILGGLEVKLIELANLYSTLANLGYHENYKLRKDVKSANKRQIFSEEASFIISEMLAEDHYLSSKINWKTTLGNHKIAWKTGTSYAHRDAWSFGYDKDYTVGVWIGNFDNRESSDIVGILAATPLMFDIFKSITDDLNPQWLNRPSGVGTRRVSTASGKLPREYDTQTKEELYIIDITSKEKDMIRQKIIVDKETGYRLYYHCMEDKDYEEKVMEIWPGNVRTWMEKNGYPVDTIPPVHPDCQILLEGEGPKIETPSDNSVYYIRNDLPIDEQKITFRAHPEKGNKKVFWFIDDVPFGVSEVGEDLLYTPEEGKHKLTVMDEEGRTTTLDFKVLNVRSIKDKNG